METAKKQIIAGKTPDQGWWSSGDSFGITSAAECTRFSPHDERIYTTALLAFANMPFRSYRPLHSLQVEAIDVRPVDTEPDIKVIIR
jgi:hypothetical protein